MLNVNLAVVNLLPIPVLDGGHMLFATIARLRRRALPTGFIQEVQSAFFMILISMMLYVSFFDVRRIARDVKAPEPKPAAAPAAPAKPEPVLPPVMPIK